jgi:putative tricarboxylic transport membrane protein
MWTLAIFGVVGYGMRSLGFPLAPMILGVVLGPIAERWLSRSLALSTDPTEFLTHPWSLLFLTISFFSIWFSWYQRDRGKKPWTFWYVPLFVIATTIPLFMMNGWIRPVLGGLLLVYGGYLLFRVPAALRR